MFWESSVIKHELVADIENVEQRLEEDESEAALIAVEQFVFWVAFAVRKLADSFKLSDEFEARQWAVTVHPKRASAPPTDYLNWHHVDTLYDLDSGASQSVTLRRLTGLLIHSFVFMPVTDEAGRKLEGILFNSDRTKDVGLYHVRWSEFCALIHALYDDDVVQGSYDRRTGRLEKRGPLTADPPPDL